jgi:predicted secreted protein
MLTESWCGNLKNIILKDQADVKNNTKMDLAENLGYKNGR